MKKKFQLSAAPAGLIEALAKGNMAASDALLSDEIAADAKRQAARTLRSAIASDSRFEKASNGLYVIKPKAGQ